jgi:hypothetical protein
MPLSPGGFARGHLPTGSEPSSLAGFSIRSMMRPHGAGVRGYTDRDAAERPGCCVDGPCRTKREGAMHRFFPLAAAGFLFAAWVLVAPLL